MNNHLFLPPLIPWSPPKIRVFQTKTVARTYRLFGLSAPLTVVLSTSTCHFTSSIHLAAFTCFSIGAVLAFRQWVRRLFLAPLGAGYTGFVGDSVTVTQTIPVHGLGRVLYRGTEWSARTAVGKTHKPGDGMTIRRVEGIVLVVE